MLSHSEHTEESLAKAIGQNSRQAMHTAYIKYAPEVMGVCRRYIAVSADAEDLLQEVFLRAFERIGTFTYRGHGSLGAWLRRIAINEAISFLRHKHDFIALDTAADMTEESPPDTTNLTMAQILGCIQQLPTIYRVIFNLSIIDDKSHNEIAEMLDIDPRTSATRLSRAKKMLAKIINDRYGKYR